MQINEIYQRVIMDYANQLHPCPLNKTTFMVNLSNPTCGDRIQLNLELKNSVIDSVNYRASGCIIFKASLAMLSQLMIGKTLPEANELIDRFSRLMMGAELSKATEASLGDAQIMHAIVKLPMRIKCAMLPWKALLQAINGDVDDG